MADMTQAMADGEEARRACLACVASSLQTQRDARLTEHVNALLDCAGLGALAIEGMARDSGFRKEMCALLATACERAAASCDTYADDVLHGRCAEVCRRAAQSCLALNYIEVGAGAVTGLR